MSLVGRTVTALSWNLGASAVTAILLLVRTTLLTRWIAPDDFGTYTLAYAIAAGSSIVASFGLSKAFLHRSPESSDEQDAAATHFTLQVALSSAWCILVIAGTLFFAQGDVRIALLVITPAIFGILLTQTPRIILVRRVVHRRLALLTLANVVLTTAVALPLAWKGAGLWALLATDVVAVLVHVAFLYGWRPVWKPRFRWSPSSVRYFLRFGGQSLLADLSTQLLNRLDDIWTGIYLGRTSLGHYSRAYAFAGHPGRLLAGPVNAVAGGTYADLKDDRSTLSKAFFRINALLVRGGFFVAGLLFLAMPEFISLFLTDSWLPMLPAFRLLLLFTLLSPIRGTVADLYVAVGDLRPLLHASLIHLVALLTSLYVFGTLWGIAGVAIAVDVMLLTGLVFLLWGARRYVDCSWRTLLLVPVLALVAAVALPLCVLWRWESLVDPWLSATVKILLFSGTYLLIWLAFEWKEVRRTLSTIRRTLGRDDVQSSVFE